MLNTDKLQLVADFIDVPVSYFFEERFKVTEPEGVYMSSEEIKFLRRFKRINKKYKKAILQFMGLAAKV